MNVILYIGHHKVGSTALQVFLAQNVCALLQAGILYPCVEMQGFSQLLARAIGEGDTNRWLPANPREPHSALAYRMIAEVSDRPIPPQFKMLPSARQMLHAIRQQVDYLKPHTVILCSEAFANFGDVDPDLIPLLRTAFPDAPVQIYCALRRPDDYLTAWHGQRIKVGEKIPPLREAGPRQYEGTIHSDYRRVVAPWIEKLPNAQLHLRNYGDVRVAGGSPADFFAQIGVTLPEGLFPAGHHNPSLPLAAMEIKRRANLVLPRGEAEKLAQHILKTKTEIDAVQDSQIEMFGPSMRTGLLDQFTPVAAYLNTISEKAAFFPDIDQIAAPRPVPELEAAKHYLSQLDAGKMPTNALKTFIASLQRDFNSTN